MKRNYKAGAAESPPPAPTSPSEGYPTEGNPTTGTPATTLGAWWVHTITESITSVIEEAGLPLEDSPTQFRDALLSLLAGRALAPHVAFDNPDGVDVFKPNTRPSNFLTVRSTENIRDFKYVNIFYGGTSRIGYGTLKIPVAQIPTSPNELTQPVAVFSDTYNPPENMGGIAGTTWHTLTLVLTITEPHTLGMFYSATPLIRPSFQRLPSLKLYRVSYDS